MNPDNQAPQNPAPTPTPPTAPQTPPATPSVTPQNPVPAGMGPQQAPSAMPGPVATVRQPGSRKGLVIAVMVVAVVVIAVLVYLVVVAK